MYVTLPKTIDNDIWGTDITFGFQSAVNIATNAIDCIHTTAASHGRVFIVEVMGHKVGWLTLHAGIAGGADIILLPEIPYDIDSIVKALEKRTKEGKRFSILAVAEGCISKEEAELSKKEFKAKRKNSTYPRYLIRSDMRSRREPDRKYVLRYRDICNAVVNRALMTACCQQDWALRQPD